MTLAGRSANFGQANLPNKFTGKEWDVDFGLNLNYFGARYYDPAIGRFLSVDRFADKYPSHTPYHYTLNNPLRFIDINGDSVEVGFVQTAPGNSQHLLLMLTNEETGKVSTIEGMPTNRESGAAAMVGKIVGAFLLGLDPQAALADGGGFGQLENKQATDPAKLSDNQKEVVPSPEGMTDAQFQEALTSAADTYTADVQVDYAPVPTGEKGNSNSFVGSVLRACRFKISP